MPRNESSLNRARLDLLLAHIGRPEQYEELRRRLIAYFRWEQCREPEELADETIDRLARRLAEDAGIADWKAYAAGIARLVNKEHRASLQREAGNIREFARRQPSESAGEESAASAERDAQDLEACMQHFTASQRAHVLRYYSGNTGLRIENRKTLAGELGLSLNALRNRMLRLRKLLVECMAARAGGRDESLISPTPYRGDSLTGDDR